VKKNLVNTLSGRFSSYIRVAATNFKDILLYLAANVVGALLSYFTLPFFTNHLTPEDFGIWGYVLTANSFLSPIIALDLHSYYLVQFYKTNEKGRSSLFNSLISFSFIWTCLFLVIALLLGSFVFEALNVSIPFHPYMSLTLLSNLTSAFFLFLLMNYRLERRSVNYAFLTILQSLLSFSLSMLLIQFYKSGVISRISGYTIGQVLLGLYCLFVLKKKYGVKFRIEAETIRKSLWFASPLIPYSLALFLFDFLDRFFLEKSMSLAETGYYSLAFQFTSLLSVFFIAVLRLFEPDIVKWIANRETGKFVRFINGYLILLSLVSISLALLAPFFLSLVANPRFKAAGLISINLVSAFYFKSVLLLLFTIIVCFSKTRFQMLLMIGAVLVFGLLGSKVTYTFKTQGLILLKTGIYGLMSLAGFLYIHKYIKLRQSMWFALCLGALIVLYCNFYK
jgi:O-antigen/teichoic acid export membrane protein